MLTVGCCRISRIFRFAVVAVVVAVAAAVAVAVAVAAVGCLVGWLVGWLVEWLSGWVLLLLLQLESASKGKGDMIGNNQSKFA